MNLEITKIEAVDIQDAWFQCISKVLDVGFKYEIQGRILDRLEWNLIK